MTVLESALRRAGADTYEVTRVLIRLYRFEGRTDDVRRLLRESFFRAPDPAIILRELWALDTTSWAMEAWQLALAGPLAQRTDGGRRRGELRADSGQQPVHLGVAHGPREHAEREPFEAAGSLALLGLAATFLFTNRLWMAFIGDTHTGLRHIAALIVALACPYVYRIVKAIVAWKWPKVAEKMGDAQKPGT